jgi:hypothetical protein
MKKKWKHIETHCGHKIWESQDENGRPIYRATNLWQLPWSRCRQSYYIKSQLYEAKGIRMTKSGANCPQ